MPANQIQYSEKYYDDVYEYRHASNIPICSSLASSMLEMNVGIVFGQVGARGDTLLPKFPCHWVTTDKYPDA